MTNPFKKKATINAYKQPLHLVFKSPNGLYTAQYTALIQLGSLFAALFAIFHLSAWYTNKTWALM